MNEDALPNVPPFYAGKAGCWTPGDFMSDPIAARRSVEKRVGYYLMEAARDPPYGGLCALTEAFIRGRWLTDTGHRNPLSEAGHRAAREIHRRVVDAVKGLVRVQGWGTSNDLARALAKNCANGLSDLRFLETMERFLSALQSTSGAVRLSGSSRPRGKANQLMDIVQAAAGKRIYLASLKGAPFNLSNPSKFAEQAMRSERGRSTLRRGQDGRRVYLWWAEPDR